MMVEGAGEAIAGSAPAGAAEAAAGEPDACLNCRAPVTGEHCGSCGQKAHVHRTASAVWHDIAHGVFHVEGKIWRTLPLLVWQPGELTRRYVDGERTRFLSPMATFLFSVLLMFATMNFIGGKAYWVDPPDRAAAPAQAKSEAGMVDLDLADAPGPLRRFDSAYRKAKANPSLLAYKLQSNAYKLSWALIPISVPLVWLLFLHRRRYRAYGLYDHTVFVTYSIAFMSLALVAFTFLKLLGLDGTWALLPLAVPPIHMYRQLRGAYRLSPSSALWRTALLVVFAFVAGALFFALLLMLGVLG